MKRLQSQERIAYHPCVVLRLDYLRSLSLSKTFSPYMLQLRPTSYAASTEAKFLDVIRTKIVKVFLLAFHSHLY